MKSITWYLLVFLIILPIQLNVNAGIHELNPYFGLVSFIFSDLPEPETISGCKCEGPDGLIWSPDRILSRKCPCQEGGKVCKCNHDQGSLPRPLEQDLPPDPIERTAKVLDKDCDASIKSQIEPALPYKRFKPMSRKEMWVLSDPKTCAPCKLLHKELEKLQKRGWKVDFGGDLSSTEKFHIRVIDLDKFEGVPDFFFTKYEEVEGINLPTIVLWEDYKLNKSKTTVGFMDVFAIDKLWGKKD
jgi:hypothetical protein